MQVSLENIETQKSNPVFRLNFSNPNMVSSCRGDAAFSSIFLYTMHLSLLTFYSFLQELLKLLILGDGLKEMS